MHRFPKLFTKSKQMEYNSNSNPSTPKHLRPRLDRRNAAKNIDYEPSHDSVAIRTHSIDVYPWGNQRKTSFRINGFKDEEDNGELEFLCKTLGLSGPEDFSIPAHDYRLMKARSAELLCSSSRVTSSSISLPIHIDDNNASSDHVDLCESTSMRSTVLGIRSDHVDLYENTSMTSPVGGIRSDHVDLYENTSMRSPVGGIRSDNGDLYENTGMRSPLGGIRGERPPAVLLAPPPRMVLPIIDDDGSSSSWDILRSFGPSNDRVCRIEDDQGGSSSDEDDDVGIIERVVGVPVESSFSTNSNDDDDCSSTATDHMPISPNGRLRRQITSWAKGKHLGSGSYGSVYEGIADGGFFFAVKEVSLLDQGDRGREIIFQFEQEMTFLSEFEHKNIVRYLGTDKDDSNLYIFLELVPQGSLLSLYQRFRFQDSHVSVYTRQILEGLKYLHERNVVHRDIKCANILLDVDGYVKLADFGLAKVAKLNDAKSTKGTSYWMAPEVVKPNQWYGRAADIWSLGCTVLEMLTQNFPYHPLDGYQAMFKIGTGQPPPVPDSLSRDARDFILKCLQVDPDIRPSAAELLEHSFVKRPHSSSASASPHRHGLQA